MAVYLFRASDQNGKEIQGQIKASAEAVVLERLQSMGYFPTEIKKVQSQTVGEVNLEDLPGLKQLLRLITRGRVRLGTLTSFTRELATLLDAGLPLLRSLELLQRNTDSTNLKTALSSISESVAGGSNLSEAMSRHPRVFSPLFVNMVRAGEIGGVLEEVLDRLATYYEKTAALRSKILSALYYPVTVLVISVALVTLILTFIVPRLQEIYEGMGVEFPAMTQALIDASMIVRHQTPYVLGGIVLLVFLIHQVGRTRSGRYGLDLLKLKIPGFGILIQKAAIARFARTFSTLLEAGVPILQSLWIVRETSANAQVAEAVVHIHTSIREGGTVAEAMKRHSIFPELLVHMIAVGEETGKIDPMLNKVAESYERQVDHAVDGLSSLLEPLMIVGLGVLIGFIVIALYLPILKPPVF